MVQEANVKRAQAEKALAESEMKVSAEWRVGRSKLVQDEPSQSSMMCQAPGITQVQLAAIMMTVGTV